MKASVLFEQGTPLSVEELDLEPPRAGEVAVRMAAMRRCQAGIVMVTRGTSGLA